MTTGEPAQRIDATVANPARRYNYWAGGKDHFAVDRRSGDWIAERFPTVRTAALENRRYMQRVVAFLTRDLGIRQFLDIGCGIPMSPDVHEITQRIAAESRVVYVDHDALVMAHARALTTGTGEGALDYIEADLRQPEKILTDPALHATLDLQKPVALLLIAVLHFLTDADDPHAHLASLINALPRGSVVVLSHTDETQTATAQSAAKGAHGPFQPRTKAEVGQFLAGLELLDPGVVSIVDWLPERQPGPLAAAADVATYGAVARLP